MADKHNIGKFKMEDVIFPVMGVRKAMDEFDFLNKEVHVKDFILTPE
jgi:hypothetical protein